MVCELDGELCSLHSLKLALQTNLQTNDGWIQLVTKRPCLGQTTSVPPKSRWSRERAESRRLVACQQRCCSHQSSGENNSTPAAGCRGRSSLSHSCCNHFHTVMRASGQQAHFHFLKPTKNLGLLVIYSAYL